MMISAKTQLLLAVFASAALVSSQSTTTDTAAPPTSTTGIPACILDCVTTAAASAGCSSFTDLQCVCTSASFVSAATSCLTSKCTPVEVGQAQALQLAECANISGAVTSTGTSSTDTSTTSPATTTATTPTTNPTTTGTSTGTGTGTTTTAAPASTSKSSAEPRQYGALGLVGAFVGCILGLVL